MSDIFFGRNSNAGSGTKSDPYPSFASASGVTHGDVLWGESGYVFSEQFPTLWVQANNLRLDVWGGSKRPEIDMAVRRADFTWNATYQCWTRTYASNIVGCVRMDGSPLTFVEWKGSIAATRGAMTDGSWTFDGVNFILYIDWPSSPVVHVAESLYCANLNYARSGLRITGWAFKGATRHAFQHYGRTDFVYTDLEVGYCGGHYIGGSAVNLGNGIELTDGTARGRIVRPWIHDVFDSGISPQLYDENATLSDIAIVGATIERCGQAGVEVSIQGGTTTVTMERVAVEDCDVRESGYGWSGRRYNGGWGIQVIANKTGAGFTVSHVGVRKNRISDCADAGIVLSRWKSSSLEVAGNEMDRCGQGIRTTYIAGETAGYGALVGNIARDCTIGIKIACDVSGTVLDLINNTLARCDTGVSLEHSAGTVNLKNNGVAECDVGISVTGAGTVNKDKNALYGNGTDYSGTTQGTDTTRVPRPFDDSYRTLLPSSEWITGGGDQGLRQGYNGLLRAPYPLGASNRVALR